MSTASQLPTIHRSRMTSLLLDYAELTKLRVTTLIVMTAWCGYFLASRKAVVPWLSFGLVHALLGIGLGLDPSAETIS